MPCSRSSSAAALRDRAYAEGAGGPQAAAGHRAARRSAGDLDERGRPVLVEREAAGHREEGERGARRRGRPGIERVGRGVGQRAAAEGTAAIAAVGRCRVEDEVDAAVRLGRPGQGAAHAPGIGDVARHGQRARRVGGRQRGVRAGHGDDRPVVGAQALDDRPAEVARAEDHRAALLLRVVHGCSMTGAPAQPAQRSASRADIADVSVFLPTVGQLARVVAGPVNLVAVVERIDRGAVVLDVHGVGASRRPGQAVVQLRVRRRAADGQLRVDGQETSFSPSEKGARFAQRRETFRVSAARARDHRAAGPALDPLHDAEPVDRRRAARDRAPVRAHRPADRRDRVRRRPVMSLAATVARSEHGAMGLAVAFTNVSGADERRLSTLIAAAQRRALVSRCGSASGRADRGANCITGGGRPGARPGPWRVTAQPRNVCRFGVVGPRARQIAREGDRGAAAYADKLPDRRPTAPTRQERATPAPLLASLMRLVNAGGAPKAQRTTYTSSMSTCTRSKRGSLAPCSRAPLATSSRR